MCNVSSVYACCCNPHLPYYRHLGVRRHYGALQGMDKKQTVEKFGKAQVDIWRRSYGKWLLFS